MLTLLALLTLLTLLGGFYKVYWNLIRRSAIACYEGGGRAPTYIEL